MRRSRGVTLCNRCQNGGRGDYGWCRRGDGDDGLTCLDRGVVVGGTGKNDEKNNRYRKKDEGGTNTEPKNPISAGVREGIDVRALDSLGDMLIETVIAEGAGVPLPRVAVTLGLVFKCSVHNIIVLIYGLHVNDVGVRRLRRCSTSELFRERKSHRKRL